VEGNVNGADRDRSSDSCDLGSKKLGKPHAATLHTQKDNSVNTTIAFEDFMRHSGHCPAHIVRPEDLFTV
tara:strand:+ start:235 stop:444 length:210 start_codon:yes stop_codon:yes gene_type:complete